MQFFTSVREASWDSAEICSTPRTWSTRPPRGRKGRPSVGAVRLPDVPVADVRCRVFRARPAEQIAMSFAP